MAVPLVRFSFLTSSTEDRGLDLAGLWSRVEATLDQSRADVGKRRDHLRGGTLAYNRPVDLGACLLRLQ